MISSILLKDVASYDSDTGVIINNLKKLNFFFGFNGSGKSTIAKFMYNLSLPEERRLNEFKQCYENGFDSTNHQILVFDENFTDENFNKNPMLKGVFSLNEKNEHIDNEIQRLQDSIEAYKGEIQKKGNLKDTILIKKAQKEKLLLESCWSKRKTFSTFSKISLSYSGSKPNHYTNIKNILNTNPIVSNTIEILADRYNKLYEIELSEITISINISIYKQLRHVERDLEKSLQEVIIGNDDVDIAPLIKLLSSNAWTETGIKYLEQTKNICPFCQNATIDEKLRKQFSEYFDRTYKEKLQTISTLLNTYKEIYNSFLNNILEVQNLYNHENTVSNLYIKLKESFTTNLSIIEDKLRNSNEKKTITFVSIFKPLLSQILKSIQEINMAFSESDTRKTKLTDDIWSFMAQECKHDIDNYTAWETKSQRVTELADKLIKKHENKVIQAKTEIESLRSNTVNTAEAVEKINTVLKNSGFESFEIAEKDKINNISHYFLKRPNANTTDSVFKSLSEGEKNFISFLYFYQLCIGTDNIENHSTKRKIIVIDDPVSSLDSQALFVVSTLIQQLILRKVQEKKSFNNDNILQVFILTHNLYFYKEVSFNRKPICTDTWYYKIVKTNNKTNISGNSNNTIFDDYSMLWQTLKELKDNIPDNKMLNIVIANTMRRIIETYVKFIGLGNDSWGAILNDNQVSPEYYLKSAFISIINDESHKVTALDSVYFQKLSVEQPNTLFNVFKEIFKTIGKEHYEMMMEESFEN